MPAENVTYKANASKTANTNTRNKKVKQIKQEIKEKEAIDAVIDQ